MADGGAPVPRRPRGPATFRQRDLTAAVKAAKAAGAGAVEVAKDGTIRVIVAGEPATMPETNPWDDEG